MDTKDMTPAQILEALQALVAQIQTAPPTPIAPPHPIASAPSIDPFLPWGAANTWHSAVTGHVISLPDTYLVNGVLTPHEPIEGISSYAWRVSDQAHAGGDMGSAYQIDARNSIGLGYGIGVPLQSTDANGDATVTNGPLSADKSDWALAVDWYFNRRTYLGLWAPKQLARELAAEKAQQDARQKYYGTGGQ